jgi:hypothetical protein
VGLDKTRIGRLEFGDYIDGDHEISPNVRLLAMRVLNMKMIRCFSNGNLEDRHGKLDDGLVRNVARSSAGDDYQYRTYDSYLRPKSSKLFVLSLFLTFATFIVFLFCPTIFYFIKLQLCCLQHCILPYTLVKAKPL